MDLTWRIDPDSQLVTVTVYTRPSIDEWMTLMDTILADSGFRVGYGLVADCRAMAQLPTSDYLHQQIAYIIEHRALLGATRWAVVAPPGKPAAFGMGRMVEMLGDVAGLKIQVFTDLREATEWAKPAPSKAR